MSNRHRTDKSKSPAAPPAVRRIGLACSQSHDAAQRAHTQAQEFLKAAGLELFTLEEVLDGQSVDAMVSLGGDGTLLHAARLMAPLSIPVLGLNFGRVGYLCGARGEQLEPALESLQKGTYTIDPRAMLRAVVSNRREEVWQVDALNEFLVGGSTRTLTLDISIDGFALGSVRGDGIIVATRTGSTAYAMSAGGPVVTLESIILVTSNAISSSVLAPAVLPMASKVKITNSTRLARPYVIADGQKDYQIEQGTEIEISQSPIQALLIDPGLVSPTAKLGREFVEPR